MIKVLFIVTMLIYIPSLLPSAMQDNSDVTSIFPAASVNATTDVEESRGDDFDISSIPAVSVRPDAHANTLLIDGGGIRGIVPSEVLMQLERDSGKPIHQLFLAGITGTSTGAILAAALTCVRHRNIEGKSPNDWIDGPYPASVIAKFYEQQGGHIFNDAFVTCEECCTCSCCPPSCTCCECAYQCNGLEENCCCCFSTFMKFLTCQWLPCCREKGPMELATEPYEARGCCESIMRCFTCSNNGCGCCGPRYTNTVLRGLLDYYFDDMTLNDVIIPLQVVAYKISGDQHEPVYFQKGGRGSSLRLTEIVLASAAAPTYFPLIEIAGQGMFVDGGVFENSAGLSALRYALTMEQASRREQASRNSGAPFLGPVITDFKLLSIGTGEIKHSEGFASGAQRAGLIFWAKEAIELSITGAAQASHENIKQLFNLSAPDQPNYFRLQFQAIAQKLAMDTTEHIGFLQEQAKNLYENEEFQRFKERILGISSAASRGEPTTDNPMAL